MAAPDEARAPALWEAELANVLGMATRNKILTIQEATTRPALADSVGIHAVPNQTLRQGALVRAHQSGVAAYNVTGLVMIGRAVSVFPEGSCRKSASGGA